MKTGGFCSCQVMGQQLAKELYVLHLIGVAGGCAPPQEWPGVTRN
jgi:hypothetical protein